jgi:hypothetical protein
MTDEKKPNEWITRICGYFTRQDLLVIVVLAIIAYLTGSYGLSHILPGGSAPGLVHGFLKLPGPGAGIFIGSAFACLWLVLSILITRKKGTVLLMAILMLIISTIVSLAKGGQPRFDILAILVALIIEGVGMLALDKKPWKYVFPVFLTIMGIITLLLMLTGNAKMGESGAAATVFPLGYAVSGILAIALAIILFAYPSAKYIAGAGCAELFSIAYHWTFHGKQFLTWVPVPPAIPALLTFAFVCGAVMAAIAYGAYLLWETYVKHGAVKPAA